MIGLTVFCLATGSTALVARHIGGRTGQGRRCGPPVNGSGPVCSGRMIAFLFAARGLLGVLFRRSEAAVLNMAAAYVRVVTLAMVLNYFLIVINAILRGAGDTKTPMRITALVNVINIIGNTIFIYGVGPFPPLGVTGAAIGTAVAQAAGGIIALRILFRHPVLRVRITDSFRPDPSIIRRIANIGIPAGLEQGMMRIAQLVYTMIVRPWARWPMPPTRLPSLSLCRLCLGPDCHRLNYAGGTEPRGPAPEEAEARDWSPQPGHSSCL